MSKSDKKRKRQEAIRAEIARRERERQERSLLSKDDMLDLLGYVAERIMTSGHTHDFAHTQEWLSKKKIDAASVLNFFGTEKIWDDWSLCTEGDPYKLFGASSDRLSWMPIDRPQLEALLEWLEDQIAEKGCNNDVALTTEWLQNHSCPLYPTLMALLAQGGGCDCEVALNVEIESIYP